MSTNPDTVNPTEFILYALSLVMAMKKNSIMPLAQVSKASGIHEKVIRKYLRKHCWGEAVSLQRLPNSEAYLLEATEPLKECYLVAKDEICEKTSLTPSVLRQASAQSGIIWMSPAGWVVLPPRNPEVTITGAIPPQKKETQIDPQAAAALKSRQAWTNSDIVELLEQTYGAQAAYILNKTHKLKHILPGWWAYDQNPEEIDIAPLLESQMNTHNIGRWLIHKESQAKLGTMPLWKAGALLHAWAKWLRKEAFNNDKCEEQERRFARVVNPEEWGLSKEDTQFWVDRYRILKKMPVAENPGKSTQTIPDEQLHIVAALILQTGGASISDINTIFGKPAMFKTATLTQIENLNWVIPGKNLEWREANPAAKEALLETLRNHATWRREQYWGTGTSEKTPAPKPINGPPTQPITNPDQKPPKQPKSKP